MPPPESPKAQEAPKPAAEPASPPVTAPKPAPTPPPAPPAPKPVAPPALNPIRAAAILDLTGKGRALFAEMTANGAKVAELQERNVAIRRELGDIDAKVRENAWDGQPLPAL